MQHTRLLNLFEQAPSFVAFLNGKQLLFELANQAYRQLVGHREVLGRPIREALPELQDQGYFELLDRVFETGEAFVGRGMKVTLQREPGAPREEAYVDFIYQPIRGADDAVVGILVQGYDVTETKRQEAARLAAEAARRTSEERYRTLIASLDDGYCLMEMIVDAMGKTVDYRFLEANSAFEQHTGLKNALGKTARELVPDLDASWFELYARVAETGETLRFENHAPAMGRWFDVFAHRVGPPERRRVALVFKDVTDRKQAQHEREALLAREQSARVEAERANRLKDEFLATASHELRTPLNAMLGWAVLLRSRTLTESKRAEAAEIIERNARAQVQLIDDILDVSRIITGKLRLNASSVDLGRAVAEAIEAVRLAADLKGVLLEAALEPDAWTSGDADRLQQVAWNLLTNAIKFTPPGGRVRAELRRDGAHLELTIRDSGRGISPEFLPHVFERFRQADAGTTRGQPGLGLGLAIVKHLVEAHGGSVRAHSEGPGHGATFVVCIPVDPELDKSSAVEPMPHSPAKESELACKLELDSKRVLVVDDEADARELLRSTLEPCGAIVTTAASAQEAYELFVTSVPDVVVSDIGMPGEDGYTLIRRIRSLPADAGGAVPAAALTAYARTEDRARALSAGFTNHVSKPVEPRTLIAAVAALCHR